MIQRCPKCGNWEQSERRIFNTNLANARGEIAYTESQKKSNLICDVVPKVLPKTDSPIIEFSKKVIPVVGEVVGDAIATYNGISERLNGFIDPFSHYFQCHNCKNEWIEKENSRDYSKEYFKEKRDNFKDIPETERRFLFVDRTVSTMFSDVSRIVVLQDFPDGITYMSNNCYPVERTLYAIHPGNNLIYIPLDSFPSILLDDELSDLRIFLQALGAESARIENDNENISETNNKSTFSNKIKGSKIGVGKSEVNVDIETEKQEYRKIAQKYFSEFKAEQKEYPYIREDLKNKWFKIRPKWEKAAQLRLNGAISDTIEISSVEITESWKNEINQLAVEYENIESKLGNSTKTSMFKRLKTAKSFILKIEVEYYPLSSYKKDSAINDWLSNIFKKKN